MSSGRAEFELGSGWVGTGIARARIIRLIFGNALRQREQKLRPRRIELDNVDRLRNIDFCHVVCSPAELEAALGARLTELSLAWTST